MRKTSGERGPVVEGELGLALGLLELLLERFNLVPILEHLDFFIGEVRLVGNYKKC